MVIWSELRSRSWNEPGKQTIVDEAKLKLDTEKSKILVNLAIKVGMKLKVVEEDIPFKEEVQRIQITKGNWNSHTVYIRRLQINLGTRWSETGDVTPSEK